MPCTNRGAPLSLRKHPAPLIETLGYVWTDVNMPTLDPEIPGPGKRIGIRSYPMIQITLLHKVHIALDYWLHFANLV